VKKNETKCKSESWYHSDEAQRQKCAGENVKPPICGIKGSDATIVNIGQPCEPFQTMRGPSDPTMPRQILGKAGLMHAMLDREKGEAKNAVPVMRENVQWYCADNVGEKLLHGRSLCRRGA
jgi:hypothetical protein